MWVKWILWTSTTEDLAVGANCVDSLVENVAYGNIIPSTAESWEVSDDGMVWTFHLRQGQYWYDAAVAKGTEKGEEQNAVIDENGVVTQDVSQ